MRRLHIELIVAQGRLPRINSEALLSALESDFVYVGL